MKTINIKTFVIMLSISIILFSCKKESSSKVSLSSTANDEATVIREKSGPVVTMTIKPGTKDGQDTYVSKLLNHPADGNTNLDYVHEIVMGKWNYSEYNDSAIIRSYIRFDSLSNIPSTAVIISAKLKLYGEPSSNVFPFGNSYYIGSSNPENSCVVQRVTGGTWQENTITFNNMPATTTKDQASFPASTTQFNYNTTVDVTAIVAKMVSLSKNYGFCIRLTNEFNYRAIEFSTSEATNKALRPKLIIQYQ